ncbi:hypothetical protein QYF36_001181 [Acer negundo]|nr:hypothetical protein QYF36_001181 [Acer negundo]
MVDFRVFRGLPAVGVWVDGGVGDGGLFLWRFEVVFVAVWCGFVVVWGRGLEVENGAATFERKFAVHDIIHREKGVDGGRFGVC